MLINLVIARLKVHNIFHLAHQLLKPIPRLDAQLLRGLSINHVDGVLADIVHLRLALLQILPRCQKHFCFVLHVEVVYVLVHFLI